MPHLLALTVALLHLHDASGFLAIPQRSGTTLRSKVTRTTASKMAADEKYDVVVIGSGPVGSTFARCLSASGEAFGDLNGGKKVLMVDAGKKMSEKTGEHIKNSLLYQSDHAEGKRLFSQFIAGTVEKISRPWTGSSIDNINPTANQPGCNQKPKKEYKKWNMNLQNPDQKSVYNLPEAAVSYKVGGMGAHWTCSCPRPHPELEMNALFPSDGLFTMAEDLLNVNQNTYDDEIRNVLVGDRLKETIDKELDPEYPSQYLPLAVKRVNDQYVDWTGPSVILGDKLAEAAKDDPNFTLKQETICKKLHFEKTADGTGQTVEYAELFNPKTGETTKVYADTFVACCGQVHTAQLLAASGLENDANGRYLCTQPMYFTRLAFGNDLVKRVKAKTGKRFNDVINAWQEKNPHDPIPIPRSGKGSGEVQCWIPVQKDRPWHCQIHNDNFYYGTNTSPIDDRLVVGLRWFAVPKMSEENRVTFTAPDNADGYFDMMGVLWGQI